MAVELSDDEARALLEVLVRAARAHHDTAVAGWATTLALRLAVSPPPDNRWLHAAPARIIAAREGVSVRTVRRWRARGRA